MTQQFSKLVAFSCMVILIAAPIISIYLLVNIDQFADIARKNIPLPIQWHTVSDKQWYSLWLLTTLYIGISLAGIYYLRRAFSNFAKGQLFNYRNSRDLRLFSIFLFIQSLAKIIHLAISSILLSINHGAGQKMFSVYVGSDELKIVVLAMILWVMSDLLVRGSQLENENKQFI